MFKSSSIIHVSITHTCRSFCRVILTDSVILGYGRVRWACARSVAQSCPTLCDPMNCSLPAPLSRGFSRQEYWSGWPCPLQGDLPDSGIEPPSLKSPALAGEFFTTSDPWKVRFHYPTTPQATLCNILQKE